MTDSVFGIDGRPRARGLGLAFPGQCGEYNAITDVPGVEVGFQTLVSGEGSLRVGKGPVRTGVTAVLPRGRKDAHIPVWGAMFSLNGNGEMTAAHWMREAGWFRGPVCITNTHSVGAAHQGAVRWMTSCCDLESSCYTWYMPVIAETCDSYLNDMDGLHVTEADTIKAIESAAPGPMAEGNVGGGTGMICYEFKGGTGTASRRVELAGQRYSVGALVQANHGIRPWLNILGVPVGTYLTDHTVWDKETGSIIVVMGTDAPLLPIQIQRLARRISIGIGRTGTPSGDNSGDIFMAFSTANPTPLGAADTLRRMEYVPNEILDPLFLAVVQATEEAIVNALLAARTMTGRDNRTVRALDHDRLIDVMRRHAPRSLR